MIDLGSTIRVIPDFPVPGILFRDITTLLQDGRAFRSAIDELHARVQDLQVDVVVGMESRGFIFAAPLAYMLGVGLVPVRKLGKLPGDTLSVEYELEYGTNTLEIHRNGRNGARDHRSGAPARWSSRRRGVPYRARGPWRACAARLRARHQPADLLRTRRQKSACYLSAFMRYACAP